MKKIIVLVAGLFMISGVFAYTPTQKDQQLISGMTEKIYNFLDKYPSKEKRLGNKIIEKLNNFLKSYEKGGRGYYVVGNIKKNVLKRIGDSGGEISKKEFLEAAKEGKIKTVKDYINNGGDINAENNGQTALMNASKEGNKEIAKFLIENGADVNAENDAGNTALMNASLRGKKEIVELLIENGADIDVKNNFGYTALMFASESGKKEIVKLLIEKGADINAKDQYGKTALDKGNDEIVEILKNYEGGGIDKTDGECKNGLCTFNLSDSSETSKDKKLMTYQQRNVDLSNGGYGHSESRPTKLKWGCDEDKINVDSDTDGSGNTQTIVSNCGNGTAADYCNQLEITVNGTKYDDWYLPAKYELDAMCEKDSFSDRHCGEEDLNDLDIGGEIGSSQLWSSTEYLSDRVWLLGIYGVWSDHGYKVSLNAVQCVRSVDQ